MSELQEEKNMHFLGFRPHSQHVSSKHSTLSSDHDTETDKRGKNQTKVKLMSTTAAITHISSLDKVIYSVSRW